MNWRSTALVSVLIAGFVFLYVPIVVLVVYSFNEGRLVTVWAGWSVKWYRVLFHDEPLLTAAFLSLRLATMAGALSAFLGTLAGIALSRGGRFPGRHIFNTLIAGPLVLPEVVLGISLLLLFVAMQQAIGFPGKRGALTIVLAHTTFGMCYVALIVQARIIGLNRAVEEAAMDLGARPLKVLLAITVPLLAPAILSGFLLAFTLSLDDLVITSFVSGPGATTLPMAVFSSVRLGVKPEINALATILITVVAAAALIGSLIVARDQLRASRG